MRQWLGRNDWEKKERVHVFLYVHIHIRTRASEVTERVSQTFISNPNNKLHGFPLKGIKSSAFFLLLCHASMQ